VYLPYSVDCTIEDVAIYGTTRRMWEARGARNLVAKSIVCLGNNNGGWMYTSCCEGAIAHVMCQHGFEGYVNPHGKPKFFGWMRSTCSDIAIVDVNVHDHSLGFAQWGGYNLRWANYGAWNMTPTPGVTALIADGEHLTSSPIGVCWSGGANPAGPYPGSPDWAEFARGCSHVNFHGSRAVAGTVTDWSLNFMYIHDEYESTWANIEVYNIGNMYPEAIGGVYFSDAGGSISGMQVRGCYYQIKTGNQGYDGVIEQCTLVAVDGNQQISPLVYFNHSTSGTIMHFRDLRVSNSAAGMVRFGAGFQIAFANYPPVTFETLRIDTYYCDFAQVAYNAGSSVNTGDVVETTSPASPADATQWLRVQTPGGTSTHPAVVMVGAPIDVGTGWIIIARGAQRRVTAQLDNAASIGDLWETTNAKRGHANNASTTPNGRVNFRLAAAGVVEVSLKE
jgi:hypothetical protein